MPSFLKKMVMFLRNITIFLENIKVFLQHGSVPKLNRPIPSSAVGARSARPKTVCFVSSGRRTLPLGTKRQHYPHFDTSPCLESVYVRIRLHIRWHQATRIYASGHTYIRIELHVRTHEPARIYVIVSGSVISCTRV